MTISTQIRTVERTVKWAESMPSTPARSVFMVVVSVLLLAGTLGCTRTASRPSFEEEAGALTPTTEADIPDALPDPRVGPGECEIITYTPPSAPNEQEGELCRPESDQRDVAVMVVHGGSGIGGSHEGMRPWANALLAEGYVVFMPGYHLFTPDGTETPVFPEPEQNIKAAVQFLRGTARAIGISRDRIVVQGMSAGARIASVAFTTPDDSYFEGPLLWPDISDRINGFIGYYHPYDGSMQFSDQYYGGPDNSNDRKVITRWAKADAISNADDAVGPALLITGSKDWNLQIDQQELLAKRLRDNNLSATTLVIKGGGHGFDQSGSSLTRLGRQALTTELEWLNNQFPQDPPRDAQVDTSGDATAPNYTGTPPSTYPTRRWHIPADPTPTATGSTSTSTVTSTTVDESDTDDPPSPPTSSTTASITSTTTSTQPTTTTTAPVTENPANP